MSDERAAVSAIVLTAMGDAWSDSEEYSAIPRLRGRAALEAAEGARR